MKDAGVVIVTHNSGDVIAKCLDSCSSLDTVVVDNGSTDDTIIRIKPRTSLRLIQNPDNRGFAAAVNQGVAALERPYILLLNPDVELLYPIQPLVEAGAAIASGMLLDRNRQPQVGFTIRRFPTAATLIFEVLGLNRLWPRNPINRRYRYLDADLDSPAEVEQPAGAFLLFRRSLWMQLGGFDTQFYPLWFEDVDFCKRAHDLGFHAQYVPEVTARHLGAHSISKMDWACREAYWYASLQRYAFKHFRSWAFRGVSAAVVLGSMLRLVGGVVSRRNLEPVAVYARIGRLAALSLVCGRIPGAG
jgi:N-acetylglucosaminyl-diphospho-decaprenol L-rhamnosyltransferase